MKTAYTFYKKNLASCICSYEKSLWINAYVISTYLIIGYSIYFVVI